MSDIILQPELLPLPAPRRGAVEISAATQGDVDWIDDLQKRHRNGLGFLKRVAIEQKVAAGQVLVARGQESGIRGQESGGEDDRSPLTPDSCLLTPAPAQRLGYCMA